MDVKQFFIKAQDAYQLIKKRKSLVIIGFFDFLFNGKYNTKHKKIIKKLKKMIKSVDKDYKRVYNIIINQIKGKRNKPHKRRTAK